MPCAQHAARAAIVLASVAIEPTARLHDALRPLATRLAPHMTVVECGDGGTCGPNSLSHVLSHARLFEGSGDDVRRRVVEHATELVSSNANWQPNVSVRELIEDSSRRSGTRVGSASSNNWGESPHHVLSAEKWLEHMKEPSAWIDKAFLLLAADCFAVEIMYHRVSNTGIVRTPGMVVPRTTVDVLGRVELAYILNRHFCAVVPRGGGGQDQPAAAYGGYGQRQCSPSPYGGVRDGRAHSQSHALATPDGVQLR